MKAVWTTVVVVAMFGVSGCENGKLDRKVMGALTVAVMGGFVCLVACGVLEEDESGIGASNSERTPEPDLPKIVQPEPEPPEPEPPEPEPPEPEPPEPVQLVPETASAFRDVARSSVYGQVGNASVTFGSVVMATAPSVRNLTTAFDGKRGTATLSRQGASTIQMDTDDAYADFGREPSVIDLPGRSSQTRYTFRHEGSRATLGLFAVDWSNDDPGDYLAGGYWLHIRTDPQEFQLGAFVGGPELGLDQTPQLPVSGTAYYRGSSTGLYATRYGTDGEGIAPGSEEIGEFLGDATLSANFDAGTIRGCIGCNEGILLSGAYYDKDTGDVSTFSVESDYRVDLGSTPIGRSNGTFRDGGVSLSNPDVQITRSEGTWAGQFSNKVDADGDPRVVAGTFTGEATTRGGSKAVFVGAFAAGAQ